MIFEIFSQIFKLLFLHDFLSVYVIKSAKLIEIIFILKGHFLDKFTVIGVLRYNIFAVRFSIYEIE